jgi:hypothetical protein
MGTDVAELATTEDDAIRRFGRLPSDQATTGDPSSRRPTAEEGLADPEPNAYPDLQMLRQCHCPSHRTGEVAGGRPVTHLG